MGRFLSECSGSAVKMKKLLMNIMIVITSFCCWPGQAVGVCSHPEGRRSCQYFAGKPCSTFTFRRVWVIFSLTRVSWPVFPADVGQILQEFWWFPGGHRSRGGSDWLPVRPRVGVACPWSPREARGGGGHGISPSQSQGIHDDGYSLHSEAHGHLGGMLEAVLGCSPPPAQIPHNPGGWMSPGHGDDLVLCLPCRASSPRR